MGAIIVALFGFVKWTGYYQQTREYDTCIDRVERSQGSNLFNRTLIEIIDRELPDREIGDELRAVIVPLLDVEICGKEPVFFMPFETGAI